MAIQHKVYPVSPQSSKTGQQRNSVTWQVTCDDGGGDLAFARRCLIAGAVSLEEFHAWVYRVVVESDSPQEHLLNLGDATDRFEVILRWRDLVGWLPSWEPSRREEHAIYGIAYARDPEHTADMVDRATALRALEQEPEVKARFFRFFPDVAASLDAG